MEFYLSLEPIMSMRLVQVDPFLVRIIIDLGLNKIINKVTRFSDGYIHEAPMGCSLNGVVLIDL